MATRKYRLQSPVRSTSSGERLIVHHQIVKTKSIINHIHVPIYELIALGKIKEARLLKEIIKFYYEVIEKRRKKPVFEPWMFTTDSCNQTSYTFLNWISQLARITTVNILSTIFFGTALIISGGFFTNLTAQNNPAKISKIALLKYDPQSPVNYTVQNDRTLTPAINDVLLRELVFDKKYGVRTDINEQNQVTGTIKSVPNNDPIIGKITFEDINTGIKYAKAIDPTGQFSVNVPDGTYKRQIRAKNHYQFIDTLSIMSDTTLNKEMIKNLPVNSTVYQNLGFSFLKLSKILTNKWRNKPGELLYRFPATNGDTAVIQMFTDRANIPVLLAPEFDSSTTYLNNTVLKGKIEFRERPDSLYNAFNYKWLSDNQMPNPGLLGWTTGGPPDSPVIEWAYTQMNKERLTTTKVRAADLREKLRGLGFSTNSIDETFVLAIDYHSGNIILQPDEINVVRTAYSLPPGTDMFPYKDSVITVVNMPPIVTTPLPDLNIFEGANETFLAKLSQHFKDPENNPLNYNINGENIIANLRNDSLFVKPVEGFSGITNLIVEAYEGNGQFASDTSEINVIHINYPPTAATLTNPAEGDTIKTANYKFKWTRSEDQNGDPLTYKIILTGTKDTTITGITDTLHQINNIRGTLPTGNYKAKIETCDGIDSTISQENNFYITTITGVQNEINTPNKFILSQNYPNPFNDRTVISYSLPKTSTVIISVYNSLGENVSDLVIDNKPADYFEVAFNSSGLPSGVYFYKIECIPTDGSESFRSIKKMIVLK